jgi:hypothetical protein
MLIRHTIIIGSLKCLDLYLPFTPPSRLLLEKLNGFASIKKIPSFLWNPEVHYRTHKRPPSVSILNQLYPVTTTPSHFLKIHLNIILPPTPWSPPWSLSLWFPHNVSIQISYFTNYEFLFPFFVFNFQKKSYYGQKFIKIIIFFCLKCLNTFMAEHTTCNTV